MNKPSMLITGIATLDIINLVARYPREDEEVRASSQLIRRGGNAANSCEVLVQLGNRCHLACTLADDSAGKFILDDIQQRGIGFSTQMIVPNSSTPTSYIVQCADTGSRTIVHYRNLAELSHQQFAQLELDAYDWFHFEGRNTPHTLRMMQQAAHLGKPVSLEIEKQRPQLESLLPLANILMFSRAFAEAEGFTCASQCLEYYGAQYPGAMLTCSWGTAGAYGWHNGQLIHSPAFPPPQIIDTIGAGDTFNAGLIHSLARHNELATALTFGCRLAGKKCGMQGFDQLGNMND